MNSLIWYTNTGFHELSERENNYGLKDYQFNAGESDIENCQNSETKDSDYADFSCRCTFTNPK